MEEDLLLKAEIREHAGSKFAEKLRKRGKIPVIVYGHKEKPINAAVDAHDFVERVHHGYRLIDLQIGRRKQKVLVKDLQYDYLGKNIIHADLMRVASTEMIKVEVPIELKGTAKGSHEGGIIEEHADRLEIECKVTDIPEHIVVSVKQVDIGDTLHAGDIELPAGINLVSPADMLIVTCALVAAVKSTEEIEEEIPVAPEVIGEAKEEAAEEESE